MLALAPRSFPTLSGCFRAFTPRLSTPAPRRLHLQQQPVLHQPVHGARQPGRDRRLHAALPAPPRPPSWPREPRARTAAARPGWGRRRAPWSWPPAPGAPAAAFPGPRAQSLGWLAGHRLPEGMWQKPESGAEGEQDGRDGEPGALAASPRPRIGTAAHSVRFRLVGDPGRRRGFVTRFRDGETDVFWETPEGSAPDDRPKGRRTPLLSG